MKRELIKNNQGIRLVIYDLEPYEKTKLYDKILNLSVDMGSIKIGDYINIDDGFYYERVIKVSRNKKIVVLRHCTIF